MNFWEIIFLFFAFQAFMLSFFFFFKKKGDKVANNILGVYLMLFSLNIVYNVLYWSQIIYTIPYIAIFALLITFWVSYPPLIYFYTRRVVERKKFSAKDLIHAVPLAVMIAFHIPFFILSPSKKQEVLFNGQFGEFVFNAAHNLGIIIVLMIFYTILTYFKFKNNQLGYNKKRWLKWLVGSFACYVFAMTSYYVLSRLGLITTGHDYFITYTLIFFVGMVSYFGFVQPDVFDGLSMDKVLPFKKYKKTGLTESHSLELKTSLVNFMTSEKPYLNSDLRLDDMANKLNLSRHHMSQIINEHFDTNFFDFINSYRIEESKRLLINETDLNITDVIFSSGFNNRVSFYKAFKNHTGITPTEFKTRQSK